MTGVGMGAEWCYDRLQERSQQIILDQQDLIKRTTERPFDEDDLWPGRLEQDA
jgi:hypothetical protein